MQTNASSYMNMFSFIHVEKRSPLLTMHSWISTMVLKFLNVVKAIQLNIMLKNTQKHDGNSKFEGAEPARNKLYFARSLAKL